MTSARKAAANRSNSLKSSGPRTLKGKARSSQNARKHGILAREVVLAKESKADFTSFRKGILEALAPVGELDTRG